MKVLTSLNPNPAEIAIQRRVLETWRAAGLSPVSFNHPTEIEALRAAYSDLELVPTENTSFKVFDQHFVCVNALLDYVAEQRGPTVLTNGDLHLRMSPEQFNELGRLAVDGMPYLLQWNVDADGTSNAVAEPCGISAFVLHPRFVRMFEASFLSLGQPWWDYWLPYVFVQRQLPLFDAGRNLAYHVRHPRGGWTNDNWCTCARELDRMFALMGEDKSEAACRLMSAQVFAAVTGWATAVTV